MSHRQPSRSVLVVVGAGGMGMSVARRLGSGRTLVLADYSEQQLNDVAGALRGEGYDVRPHAVDVSDHASVTGLADAAAAIGGVDAVVHTAGLSPVQSSAERIYRVDLLGTAHVIDAFLAVASRGTSLVCVASMAGYLTPPLSPGLSQHLATAPTDQLLKHPEIDLSSDPAQAYGIAKRGNQLRVQAAAREWGSVGARINTISPGVIMTPMGLAELDGPSGAQMRAMIELSGAGRPGTPNDIAAAVAFLAGPESSFITGTDLLVDGGTVGALRWNMADLGAALRP